MNIISSKILVFGMAIVMASACTNNETTSPAAEPNIPLSEPAKMDEPSTDHTHHETHDDEAHDEAETRSADSHTHGDAELAVVLENGVVTIELDTPLYNILGFEHAPETEAQKTAVETAEAQLGRAEALFTFNAKADCAVKSAAKDVHLFEHDDHSDHDDHDDHDEHKGHDEDAHKDVILQYEFACKNSNALSNVSVNLFELFGELSEIDATYLGPTTQRQVKLTAANSQMDISQ